MHRLHTPRPAFTLIELLVVIAIIAVLASIIVAAVVMMLGRGTDMKDVNDIEQLRIALNSFKAKYKTYPPSRIKLLPNYGSYNQSVALDKESLLFINRIWPNIGAFTNINWSDCTDIGNTKNFAGVILDGDQCLVFFLGGINGIQGFSTNPKNPAQNNAVNPDDRVKVYQFPLNRLVARKTTSPDNLFPSYMDNYQQMPFIYFAPGSNGFYNYPTSHTITIAYTDGLSPISDDVSPYFDSTSPKANKYWNPTTFQIISAGRDGRFGTLGEWNNGSSPVTNNTWKDNRANWSSYVLSAPAQ